MRFMIIVGALLLGVILYNNFLKPAPPPPPPPPPLPPILTQPKPILDPEQLKKVREATHDSDAAVRWEAARLLRQMDHPDADLILYQMLAKDQDPQLRVKVASLFADRSGPEISRHLVAALKDTETAVRIAALQALAKVGDYSTASHISDVLKDQDESVRLEAVKTLNTLQEKKNEEIRQEQARQAELKRQAEAAKRGD